jgi:hypothetical protein
MHTACATARLHCGVRTRVCPAARDAAGSLHRGDQPLSRLSVAGVRGKAAARPRASHRRTRLLLASLTSALPRTEGL